MIPDNPTETYHRQLTALYYLGAPLCTPPEEVNVALALRVALHELEVALLRVQVEVVKHELLKP